MEPNPSSIHLIPLIPLFPTSISFLDLLLPLVLLSLSLLLHIIYNTAPISPLISSHIYQATTAHARYLPEVAKHIFSYPLVVFGFDLDELERGQLDLDLMFGWEKTWRVCSMRREGYLNVGKKDQGIRDKLDSCLKERGIGQEEVGRVYLVTMPSYLGFMGINPLSVYYCYAKHEEGEETRQLKAVVLEVHNTFGERHIYVLQCGIEEDEDIAAS